MRTVFFLLIPILILSACNANPPSAILFTELPSEGDALRGEQIFTQPSDLAPPCAACHTAVASASPDLAGFGQRAATTVAGESAREYAFYSITEPARFIVPGYGNAMYNQYDEKLTPQDIADLIAYILSL